MHSENERTIKSYIECDHARSLIFTFQRYKYHTIQDALMKFDFKLSQITLSQKLIGSKKITKLLFQSENVLTDQPFGLYGFYRQKIYITFVGFQNYFCVMASDWAILMLNLDMYWNQFWRTITHFRIIEQIPLIFIIIFRYYCTAYPGSRS